MFSWGWLRRFMQRGHLSLRKPTSGAVKPQAEVIAKAVEFVEEVKELIIQGIYDVDYVINLDETGISTESSRWKTLNSKGESHIKVMTKNKSKESTTVLIGGSMSGEKLPGLLIFGDKGVKRLKADPPANLRIYHREEGSWMDRTVMLWYIRNVLGPWARKIPEGKRALLLYDNFKGHYSEEIEKALQERRIDMKLFPPHSTGMLQPMDLCVNCPFLPV